VGIALGLGAALSWGFADYFAALASRSVGPLRVVLGFHLAAIVPLAVLVLATGALAKVKLDQLPAMGRRGARPGRPGTARRQQLVRPSS
jgi:hypothetical protein